MAHIELAGSVWSNGKYIELGHPTGVIWEADFSKLPLSTASNAASLRTELANRGLTLTRASAATVQTSASTVVTSGIGVDDPRVGQYGLVIEESRQNVLPVSETINTWNVTGTASIGGTNTIVAPDGATTAELINAPASGDGYWRGGTIGAGAYRTRSIWVQSTGGAGDANLTDAGYALADTAITTGDAWVRGSSTDTSATATGTIWIRKRTSTAFRAWGGQVEAGRFATEYIPTTGAAATRAGDRLVVPASRLVRSGRIGLEVRAQIKGSIGGSNTYALDPVLWKYDGSNYALINATTGVMQVVIAGSSYSTAAGFTAAQGDVIDYWIEAGGGSLQTVVKARKSTAGGPWGAVTTLGTTSAQGTVPASTSIDLFGTESVTMTLSCWAQRIRAYAPGRRPSWC